MAIYHLELKTVQRSAGRSAVAAASYRAGERITDERTGIVHDYTRKQGVVFSSVITPPGVGTITRAELWNAAEAAEKRKDGRTAREMILALPAELSAQERKELVVSFAAATAKRYGIAVDVCIHEPSGKGDGRNHHAHLMFTTRTLENGPDQKPKLTKKSVLELSDTDRKNRKLCSSREELKGIRKAWESAQNHALEKSGEKARVDCRSFKARGYSTAPSVHLGPKATEMERAGKRSEKIEAWAERRLHHGAIVMAQFDLTKAKAEVVDIKAHITAKKLLTDLEPKRGALKERIETIKDMGRDWGPGERDQAAERVRVAWEREHKTDRSIDAKVKTLEEAYKKASKPILRWLPSRRQEREKIEPELTYLRQVIIAREAAVSETMKKTDEAKAAAKALTAEMTPEALQVAAEMQNTQIKADDRERAQEAEKARAAKAEAEAEAKAEAEAQAKAQGQEQEQEDEDERDWDGPSL